MSIVPTSIPRAGEPQTGAVSSGEDRGLAYSPCVQTLRQRGRGRGPRCLIEQVNSESNLEEEEHPMAVEA